MAIPGSIWVDGVYLRYIGQSGVTRTTNESSGGTVTGVAGSIWVESNYLSYMGTSNRRRRVGSKQGGRPSGAIHGSLWLQGERLHWIDTSGYIRYNHTDVPGYKSGYCDSCSSHDNYSGYNNHYANCGPIGAMICDTLEPGVYFYFEHSNYSGHNNCKHENTCVDIPHENGY